MSGQTIKLRRDIAARWARLNPVLDEGEQGFETDTGKFKIGDGSTVWGDLDYFVPARDDGITDGQLLQHINDLEPHPAYDDSPSLTLLYENAKV